MKVTKEILGYYDSADQPKDQPTVDPWPNAECPYCSRIISEFDCRTHSFMNEKHRRRSWFYRTHKTCDENTTQQQRDELFDKIAMASESVNDNG